MIKTPSVAILSGLLALVPMSAQTPPRAPAPAREALADLPGVRIWFRDTGGNGVPVVFLHSATGSSRNWDYQFAAFSAAGYRCIAYDRRGWGRSVVDTTVSPGTAPDDLEALMNYLGVDRFHAVGTAAGAFVTLDYAVSFPQRLRSMVIANGLNALQDDEVLEIGRRIRPAQFNALPADVRELGPSYRASNAEGTSRWLEMERQSRQQGAGPAQAVRNKMTSSLLETIKVPALVLTGDADMYAPPSLMSFFKGRMKNAEFLTLPEVGHSSYWEKPDVFNKAVLEFIRKH